MYYEVQSTYTYIIYIDRLSRQVTKTSIIRTICQDPIEIPTSAHATIRALHGQHHGGGSLLLLSHIPPVYVTAARTGRVRYWSFLPPRDRYIHTQIDGAIGQRRYIFILAGRKHTHGPPDGDQFSPTTGDVYTTIIACSLYILLPVLPPEK